MPHRSLTAELLRPRPKCSHWTLCESELIRNNYSRITLPGPPSKSSFRQYCSTWCSLHTQSGFRIINYSYWLSIEDFNMPLVDSEQPLLSSIPVNTDGVLAPPDQVKFDQFNSINLRKAPTPSTHRQQHPSYRRSQTTGNQKTTGTNCPIVLFLLIYHHFDPI